MSIFRRKKKQKTAAAFVDFEHWCYSLDRLHRLRPEIRDFYEDISALYDVKRLYFFGDFTEPTLRSYVDEIRAVTGSIIDTQNPSDQLEKDYTDFIMLDYIYQDVDQHPDTDTYIIFSGDGHFSSAAAYLKSKKRKYLVVYGIQKAMSNKLKAIASDCIELPTTEQTDNRYYRMILDNLYALEMKDRVSYPTFPSTVRAVARKNKESERKITLALRELIHRGIIKQVVVKPRKNLEFKALKPDWKLAEEEGVWRKR